MKRKVQKKGEISFKNKEIKVGRAFIGDYVAVRESKKTILMKYIFAIN